MSVRRAAKARRSNTRQTIIIGTGKSGTSAYFYLLKGKHPWDMAVYEYMKPHELAAEATKKGFTNVLLKRLVSEPFDKKTIRSLYDFYNERIIITRDPRDIIIAQTVWRIQYYDFVLRDRPTRLYFDLLRSKENNPGGLSVRHLLDYQDEVCGRVVNWNIDQLMVEFARLCDLYDAHKGIFQKVQYEVMVPQFNFELPDQHRYIKREGKKAGWRAWFTREDVDFFKPYCERYMNKFGYNFNDWTIHPVEKLDPRPVSSYTRMLVNKTRQEKGVALWKTSPKQSQT